MRAGEDALSPSSSAEELLTGSDLAKRIVTICRGTDVRVAVAFWGGGAAIELFGSVAQSRRAKIICDVTLGGTQAKALTELDAPDNKRLRHVRALHAKLYLSDRGVVIGSANASSAALGFSGRKPHHVELGVFHPAGSALWQAATKWFRKLYRSANQVDDDALNRARITYRVPPPSFIARPGSLLDAIRLNPDRFRGLGFFFEKLPLEEPAAKRARAASTVVATTSRERAIIAGCKANDMFTGLSEAQARDTSPLFLEFWRPDHRRLLIIGRRVEHRDRQNGILYTSRQGRAVRRQVGAGMPALREAARFDNDVVKKLLVSRKGGLRFLDPESLIAVIGSD